MTGESVPRHISPGDPVLSGFVVKESSVSVRATKAYKDSAASKMLDLIEMSAARKTKSERFITKFARYYTPAVMLCALAIAVVPSIIWPEEWLDWIYKAVLVLVVSCPCALVISVPLAYFCGIGGASGSGILIKGSTFIERLSKTDTVVFDKTGTLTKGEFTVHSVVAIGITEEELVDCAACAELLSTHPIGRSICSYRGGDIDPTRVQNMYNISGQGVSAMVDGRSVLVGNGMLMRNNSVDVPSGHDVPGTVVHVAVDGAYRGYICISDTVKEDSATAVSMLRKEDVRRTLMLTGDTEASGKAVSEQLGLDGYDACLLPKDKTDRLEDIIGTAGGTTVFVGDGINDAPALARADVGIAMGGLGSAAAIEAADAVIIDDRPSKVADAIRISKKSQRIVWENIVFALAVKIGILVLTPFGYVSIWLAIFGDVGVTVIAVLNSVRALRCRNRP